MHAASHAVSALERPSQTSYDHGARGRPRQEGRNAGCPAVCAWPTHHSLAVLPTSMQVESLYQGARDEIRRLEKENSELKDMVLNGQSRSRTAPLHTSRCVDQTHTCIAAQLCFACKQVCLYGPLMTSATWAPRPTPQHLSHLDKR